MLMLTGLMQIENQVIDQIGGRLTLGKIIVPELSRILNIRGQRSLDFVLITGLSINRNGALLCRRTPFS